MENTGQRTAEERSASLEEYVTSHYEKWKAKVDYMSGLLKKLPDLVELQTTVYSVRQECLEYYYTLVNKISEHSKKYKREYAERYNWYKTQSQIRYGTDSAINAQISSDLSDYTYGIEMLNALAKYMQETLKSIDDIIYGINSRVKVEELIQSYGK